jgi:hypothetical protein
MSTAPEIPAIFNPKRNPPLMAMNTIQNRNRLFMKFCKRVNTNRMNSAKNDPAKVKISPGKNPYEKIVSDLARAVTESSYYYHAPAFCTYFPFANKT